MSTHYVDSSASGANDGTSWADAWTSITSATGVSGGDTVLIDDGHSETFGGSTTLNFTGATGGSTVKLIVVDKADNSPSTGAVIQTTSSVHNIQIQGDLYVYGLTINHERNLNLNSDDSAFDHQTYENCTFHATYNSGGGTQCSAGYQRSGPVIFIGCTWVCDGDNAPAFRGTRVVCWNCTFPSTPTSGSFEAGSIWDTQIEIHASDLSGVTQVCYLSSHANIKISQCKLPASYTLPSVDTPTEILITNSDDGTITDPPLGLTHYKSWTGEIKATLAAYRTGGADDGEQANAYSWEMASSSTAEETFLPLRSPPVAIWTDPKASISGATAQGLYASTRMDPQSTPAALTTDSSSTWNGSGVGTKQKITHTMENGSTLTCYVASSATLNDDDFWIEVTEPDQTGGPMAVRFCLAKPSTTVYVDPKVEVAA